MCKQTRTKDHAICDIELGNNPRLYDMVNKQKGRIDILFANAGILKSAPLGSITESDFDKVFNIKTYSTLFVIRA
jgi:NAD(P)-dependent dehydrogenase (short-subunit alcohol dehydrogenase family)